MDARQRQAAAALDRLAPPDAPTEPASTDPAEQIRQAMRDRYAPHPAASRPSARSTSITMAGWACLGGLLLLGPGVLLCALSGDTPAGALGLLCVVIGGLAFALGLACLPGSIARGRHHHNADAIAILGLFGLIVPLLWIIALVWAHTAVRERP